MNGSSIFMGHGIFGCSNGPGHKMDQYVPHRQPCDLEQTKTFDVLGPASPGSRWSKSPKELVGLKGSTK